MENFFVLAVLLAIPIVWVTAMVQIVRTPAEQFERIGMKRSTMLVIVILFGGVSGLYFLLVIRPRIKRASLRLAAK